MRFLLLLVSGALLFAQDPESAAMLRVPTVRAQGTAHVTEKPDQVRIDIGVITQAQTAQAAGAANAKQFSEVVAELKKMLGKDAEVQTVSYSLQPNYRYPKEGGTPTITGYTANNIVRVTSPDVTSVGKVIDATTRTGANRIQGIEFGVKDEQALRGRALREAARSARENAEAMAAALGMKIRRILRVEDGMPVTVRPVREMAMTRAAAMADAPPTPVEPGTIRVEANVIVTAEIAP